MRFSPHLFGQGGRGIKNFASLVREHIKVPGTCVVGLVFHLLQPTEPEHAMENGIQASRAHVIPMPAQFLEHPLPINRMPPGMAEDMDFPEAEQNFALENFFIVIVHNSVT